MDYSFNTEVKNYRSICTPDDQLEELNLEEGINVRFKPSMKKMTIFQTDDPIYYRSLLERNKNNLKSQAAFEKSKKVTSALINNANDPKKKIDIAIEYLLCKCEDITPLVLQNILYYIQGFYYAFTLQRLKNIMALLTRLILKTMQKKCLSS